MLETTKIPPVSPEHPEVEYYKALARLAEQRARDIRRVATLERNRLEERLSQQEPTIKAYAAEVERLGNDRDHLAETSEQLRSALAAAEAQLSTLQQAQARIAGSRAHYLADVYVRYATGDSPFARVLRLLRPIARVLNRVRRWLRSKSA